MIECKGLSKSFKNGNSNLKVLKNVDLSIEQGSVVTIMGKSGSGKTTLLNCLSLLDVPNSGEIYFDDKLIDIKKYKDLESFRRKNIGYVFQNSNLIPCLNVIDNLIIAIHDQQSYALKKRKALDMLGLLGMIDKEKQAILTLSGGEMQRIAILRALINTPRIIFCDEPTGALDAETSENVINILLNLCKKYNITLVLVTHDINIGKIGDHQYIMEEGVLHATS